MLLGIISIPALRSPAISLAQTPNILWLNSFYVATGTDQTARLPTEPVAAFAGQSEATDPVEADPPADEAANDRHLSPPSPTSNTVIETGSDPSDATLVTIQTLTTTLPPVIPIAHDPAPAPQRSKQKTVTALVKKTQLPIAPEPEPQQNALQSIAIEHPPSKQTELKPSTIDEAARQKEAARIYRELAEQNRQAAEAARQTQLALAQKQHAIREQADRERAAVEKIRLIRAMQENKLKEHRAKEEAMRKIEQERIAREQAERKQQVVAAPRQENLVPRITKIKQAEQQPQQQPDKPKGIVSHPLKGDLKLVVTGPKLPEVTILFKEFTQSRRSRPLSRTEARREARINPVVAIREKLKEISVEHAAPGVYTITIEAMHEYGNADFCLKVYEGNPSMITRNLGIHAVDRKKILLKILMPEGILWDDDKAFSGSMEDSDSITKFNADTGLVWKEYTD